MKRFSGFAIWILLSVTLCARGQDLPSLDSIRQMLTDRIEKEKSATAIVVGIIDEHATNIIACGKPHGKSARQANGDTVFEIGSVSKVFTSLLLADMVKRGEVKRDDPIAKYLPAYVNVPSRKGKQLTLVDLATHSSGLPRMPDNM